MPSNNIKLHRWNERCGQTTILKDVNWKASYKSYKDHHCNNGYHLLNYQNVPGAFHMPSHFTGRWVGLLLPFYRRGNGGAERSNLTNISRWSASPHFHHQLCDPTLNISCQDNQRSSNYSTSHKHLCFLLKLHLLYWSQWDLSKCKPNHVVSLLKTVSWLPIAMGIGIKFFSVAFKVLHDWPLLPLEPHLSPALCKSDIGLLAVSLMSPFTCLTWAICTCCSFCWYFLTSKFFSCT